MLEALGLGDRPPIRKECGLHLVEAVTIRGQKPRIGSTSIDITANAMSGASDPSEKILIFFENLWRLARRFVPTQLYPFLSPFYRWRRKEHLRRLEEEDRRYLAEHPGVRIPSAELRYNVVGPCTVPQFLRSGEDTVTDIESALLTVGAPLRNSMDFLDFGCGCGRLILALRNRWPGLRITGCDVDARAISWCQENLDTASYVVNNALPPSPFLDESFDLVWCGSVFTHLDEDRQDLWLHEVHRILKPGGFLLASIHGPRCWGSRLPKWTIAKLKREGMMFARTGADQGIHPGWYQVAWHTEEYIKDRWAMIFCIRGYIAEGLNRYQDVVVAQKELIPGNPWSIYGCETVRVNQT